MAVNSVSGRRNGSLCSSTTSQCQREAILSTRGSSSGDGVRVRTPSQTEHGWPKTRNQTTRFDWNDFSKEIRVLG